MAAHVEHEFVRGFVLDEERLRKLTHLIGQHLDPSTTGGKYQFRVYRGDAFAYTTPTVEDVLKEENSDWRRLTKLEINSLPEAKPKLALSFSSQGTRLEIEGDERDKVFVLFSDVREYLTEEVNKGFYISKETKQIIGGAILFAFFATFLFFMAAAERAAHLTKAELRQVTASPDVAAKLNALLKVEERKSERGIPVRGMLIFFAVVLVLGAEMPERTWRYIWPSNVFLFGAQKVNFDKKRKVVANIFWIVVIGGIVSIVAAIVANKLSLWHK